MVSKTPPNKIADLVAPCKIYLFLASLFENGRFASHSHSIDETKPVMALMHPPKAALLHRSMYAKGTPLLECVVATAVADCHRLHHRRNDRRSCLHRCRRLVVIAMINISIVFCVVAHPRPHLFLTSRPVRCLCRRPNPMRPLFLKLRHRR